MYLPPRFAAGGGVGFPGGACFDGKGGCTLPPGTGGVATPAFGGIAGGGPPAFGGRLGGAFEPVCMLERMDVN